MNRYGDVKYTKEDIERIIAGKERRLEDLEQCWDSFTRHMECGEIRELKESCIDDEIIISCLRKERYYNCLIEEFEKRNQELHDVASALAENSPTYKQLTDGDHVFKFDADMWDIETAIKFYEKIAETHPNCSLSFLPYGMDIVKINHCTDENKSFDCSLKDTSSLKQLILENPDLPLIIFAGEDAWQGDWPYNQVDARNHGVQELTLYNDCWMDRDEYEEELSDDLCDEEEYKNLSDEEWDEMIKQKVAETEFYKAIVIYVG